jgi:hypothetical protein
MKNEYKILVRNPEGKSAHPRLGLRFEDNIRIDLREIVWEGVNWMRLPPDREQWRDLLNTLMSLRVPSNLGSKFLD